MKEGTLKLKKGGLDTIVAYIVVMLPLLYVVVYMVATIYHFSVQSYMSQVVKEATTMASTYGTITSAHESYIHGKLKDVVGSDDGITANCEIKYFVRKFDSETGIVGAISEVGRSALENSLGKSDIIGIQVISEEPSILGSVTSFNVFGASDGESALKYTAYREEIIRNENPNL